MTDQLTPLQLELYASFRAFVEEEVTPYAREWDEAESVPRSRVEAVAKAGYLGCVIPEQYGGKAWDSVVMGLLNEAFGYGSAALTGLLTVNAMAAGTLVKWGSETQHNHWLPKIASGETVIAFAMTEPDTGSDIQGIQTQLSPQGDHFLLSGTKKWITFSGLADLLLVFGYLEGQSVAFLVDTHTAGVEIKPIRGMLGFKGCHLSQVEFDNVIVPAHNIVGKPGFGLSFVAPFGLHYGRMCTAWSAVGLMRACLDLSADYATNRKVKGNRVGDFGTVQKMLTEMGVNFEAARLLCLNASRAETTGSPDAISKAFTAKYFASRSVVKAASDTVQILGAAGCREDKNAARYYRDAKIMEIIEGTTQIHEEVLGKRYLSFRP